MKNTLFFVLSFLGSLFFFACQVDPVRDIPALEKDLEAAYTDGKADTLIMYYEGAVRYHPDRPADNLHYLTKAAEIKFFRKKDAVGAVRLINRGLKDFGKGRNLTEPIGMLARIGYGYIYKSTPDLSKRVDDIDEMQANLKNNFNWIDSSLVRLEKEMGFPVVTDKEKATAFIQIAETYAALIQSENVHKHVDLLLKSAGLAKSIGNANKALQLYYSVGEKLPDHPKAPTALFMEAFIYETDLHDLDKAKQTYEKFLSRYPEDPDYADDARNALKLLGKTPEEIVREFEKQNAQ